MAHPDPGKPPSSISAQSSVPFTVRFAAPRDNGSVNGDNPMWTPSTDGGEVDNMANPLQRVRTQSMGEQNIKPPMQEPQRVQGINGDGWHELTSAPMNGQLKRWDSHSSSLIGKH